MGGFEAGRTVVRRDVHRPGRVWSEWALRVIDDTEEALVTACAPGAEARWPSLYAQAREADDDRTLRTEAFEAMAAGEWDLAPGRWQETELLWKPPGAWFNINAFFTGAGLRNWYVNFEHPTCRTPGGFDTFDLTVDLVVTPDLSRWTWKDEEEYTHVRRLGIIDDIEHQAVDDARAQVLGMLADRSGPFAAAERWALHAKTGTPAGAPKPARPGPGRPLGSKNRSPATRYDVGRVLATGESYTRPAHHKKGMNPANWMNSKNGRLEPMDSGLAALLGAAVGSATTLGAAIVNGRAQARSQRANGAASIAATHTPATSALSTTATSPWTPSSTRCVRNNPTCRTSTRR
ncbi:DUF402 domain-containing protein [Streptomyces sp. NPDC051211]|uniref:DUF402 domain-containing protein n=1 Tax=Streptomyces sp. NPDC051211 TaxID=3154643 RepID=UPI003450E4E2